MTTGQKGRRIYLVDKPFQYAFMLRFTGMVLLGVALAFMVLSAFYYLRYSQGSLAMKFFYVTGEAGSGLQETTLFALVLPCLIVSAALSAVVTLMLGLLYSHRIAGPLYHLKRVLHEVREGRLNQELRFRKGDEFHELATEVTQTIAWFREKLRQH